MLPVLAFAIILASGESYRARFPLPDATIGSGWGVNIPFDKRHPGDLDEIAAAGFKWVRTDLAWSAIERVRGRYDFRVYDVFLHELDAHHLRAILTLDPANDLYPAYNGKSGISDEAEDACGSFAKAAATHFRHRGLIWEIGNEWNLSADKTSPNQIEYRNFSATIGGSISEASKDEWLIGPGTSGFDWTYITTGLIACFGDGAMGFLDGISVHPNLDPAPEKVEGDWTQLRRFASAEAPAYRRTCLVSSGWSRPSTLGKISEEQQANYAVRSYFVNLANGVNLTIYDDWRRDKPGPTIEAQGSGVVHKDGSSCAAYRLIRSIATDLAGFRFKERLAYSDPNVNIFLFNRGRTTKVYAWLTAGDPQSDPIGPGGRVVTLSQQPKLILSRN